MDDLILQNNGVEVLNDHALGQSIIVAVKDHPLGSTLFRENPALIYEVLSTSGQDDYRDYITAFSKAPEELKAAIIKIYHPPLSSPTIATLAPIATDLSESKLAVGEESKDFMSVKFIHKLLAINKINAYEYFGNQPSSLTPKTSHLKKSASKSEKETDVENEDEESKPTRAALFIYASNVQHSCSPNVVHTSKTADGAIEFKAIRPIKHGDPITCSYIGDLYSTPTHVRRALLQKHKGLICKCDRCVRPDYSRSVTCPSCGLVQPCLSVMNSSEWRCSNEACNITHMERKLDLELQRYLAVRDAEKPLEPLYRIIRNTSQKLSSTHYIAVRAWSELATLYASKALMLEECEKSIGQIPEHFHELIQTQGLSYHGLRQKAAFAGLQSIFLTECVGNDWSGGGDIADENRELQPIYESSKAMFHTCMDLLEIPKEMYPPYAKRLVLRYLPYMFARYGENDKDCKFIEEMFTQLEGDSPTMQKCMCCGEAKASHLTCPHNCEQVYYCSKECQTTHWNNRHKDECIPISTCVDKSIEKLGQDTDKKTV